MKNAQFDPSWDPASDLKELQEAEQNVRRVALDEVQEYSIMIQKIGYTIEQMKEIIVKIEAEGSRGSLEFFDTLSLLEDIFESGRDLEFYGLYNSLEWGK